MYNCGKDKLRDLLREAHINTRRKLITPKEFEALKNYIGEPVRKL